MPIKEQESGTLEDVKLLLRQTLRETDAKEKDVHVKRAIHLIDLEEDSEQPGLTEPMDR